MSYAIAYETADNATVYLKKSSPTSIEWTRLKGFAKRFASAEEAQQSPDYARVGAVAFNRLTVEVPAKR